MGFRYIGKDYERPDAIQKITGKAVYIDDIRVPGMVHTAILRPEYAHAKIISIKTEEAEKMPGVIKVVTGQSCDFRYGDNIRDLTPMAVDRVRHIGEAVAAVIAETQHQARQALKKIVVEYEPLPVIIDALDAVKKDAVLIHEKLGEYWHLPGMNPFPGTNIANQYVLRKGDIDNGFAESDFIVEGDFNYPFHSCAAIEPHGVIVCFHEDSTIEVWSSSQCPFIVREDIAHIYKRPISDVRVHIPEMGGGFGYKSDIINEQTIAWIASFVPGLAVKWTATRKEDFLSTRMGNGIRTSMKIGATKVGKLKALKSIVHHSTGASADTGIHVLIAATHNGTGPYEFDNCYLEGNSVYTNTPPVGAFRGYGHQSSQFAMERLMDMLARKLKMSIWDLREKNYLGPGKITSLGEKLWPANGDVRKCVAIVKKAVYDQPKPREDENYFYGRGFAGIMKAPKGAPFYSKGCYLKFNKDGSVSINMGGVEMGQGLRNVVRQVAAEELMIPPERIRVAVEIDTQYSPWEWQTIGSMFTTMGGRAVVKACRRAIQMMKETAHQVLRVDIDLLEYDGESIFLRSDPDVRVAVTDLTQGYMYENGMTIGEVVQSTADARLPRYSNPDPETGQGTLGVSYTFGAQACDIRIEKKTGKIIIDHMASSFDVGRVINSQQIRGQVTGGVLMAIGATLFEQVKFDEQGKTKSALFSRYRMPNIGDMPGRSTIEFVETPEEIGPFGARGLGEHPVIGVAPAILNAVCDAIGAEFYEIPLTPDKVKNAFPSGK